MYILEISCLSIASFAIIFSHSEVRDSKRDTDVYNSLMDSVREGEGRKIWENGPGRRKITITSNFKSCNLFEITRTNRKLSLHVIKTGKIFRKVALGPCFY